MHIEDGGGSHELCIVGNIVGGVFEVCEDLGVTMGSY